MVIDESTLLDRIQPVKAALVPLCVHEHALDEICFDQKYHDNGYGEYQGRERSQGGDGLVDEAVEVGSIWMTMTGGATNTVHLREGTCRREDMPIWWSLEDVPGRRRVRNNL